MVWLEESVHHFLDWVSSLLLLLWLWEELLEEVSNWVDLLLLVVLDLLGLLWLEEVEWVVPEVLVLGVGGLVVLVVWEEVVEEVVDLLSDILKGILKLVSKLMSESLEGGEEVVDSWEHEGELVNTLEFLEGILDVLVEFLSLDVSSLDRHVPFVVEAGKLGGEFSDVSHDSVDLSHLLVVTVAGVIGVEDLGEVQDGGRDLHEVVDESILEVLSHKAHTWVSKAPVLHVISDSLEVAVIHVSVDGIENLLTNRFDLLKINGPEVLVHLLLESPSGLKNWLDVVSEAFIGEDTSVLLIPSLNPSSVHVLGELSKGLNMTEFWCLRNWALG